MERQKRMYYYNCGHSTTAPAVKGHGGNVLCPKCRKGRLQAKRCYCVECGEAMEVLSPRQHPKRCDACKLRDVHANTFDRRTAPGRKDMQLPPERYYDCRWYMYCLDKAADNPKSILACKGCRRYAQVKDSVDNYLCIGDSFDVVTSGYRVRGAG